MNIDYTLYGRRDSFGNLRVAPDLRGFKTSVTTDSSSDSILEDALVAPFRPTFREARRSTLLGRIIALFERIWRLIKQLWTGYPVDLDQRLMAALHGDRSLGAYPGLETASLNRVLQFMIPFLEREAKERPIPVDLLAQLKQCARWAQQIETLKADLDGKRRDKGLRDLAQEIRKGLQDLKSGERILVPGGWVSEEGDRGILYEMQRDAKGLFRLRLLSCDALAHARQPIPWAGKNKIYPGTAYHSLTEEEVADTAWLETLVGLQIPAPQRATVNHHSLHGLLQAFQDRLEAVEADAAEYRTPVRAHSHYKNIGVWIDERLNPVERKEAPAQRRKLKLKIASLFEYFDATRTQLGRDQTARYLVRQGFESVSRVTCLMHARGQLTDAEITGINGELDLIAKQLAQVEEIESPVPLGSPFAKLSRPETYYFEKKPLELTPVSPHAPVPWQMPIAIRSEAAPLPAEIMQQNFVFETKNPLDAVTAATLAGRLAKCRKECQSQLDAGDILPVQEKLTALLFQLEFVSDAKESIWTQMPPGERKKCSQELVLLSRLLGDAMQAKHSLWPDRLLALLKATCLIDYLARLNASETNLTDRYYHWKLSALPGDLFRFIRARLPENELSAVESYCRPLPIRSNADSPPQDFLKLFDSFSASSRPPQIEDLHQQLLLWRRLIPHQKQSSLGDMTFDLPFEVKERIWNQWGCHFDHVLMRDAAFAGRMSEGDHWHMSVLDPTQQNEEELKNSSYKSFTQESITHNPVLAMRSFFQRLDMEMPKRLGVGSPSLTQEDLRDLLYFLDHDQMLVKLMGLVTVKSYLLEKGDVRAYLYQLILNSVWNQEVIPQFGEWLAGQVEKLRNEGKIHAALFLIQVNQMLRQRCSSASQGPLLNDYRPYLKEWAHLSLHTGNALHQYRHAIWQQHLLGYDRTARMSGADLHELLLGQTVLQQSPPDPCADPLHQDSLNRLFARWQKPIRKLMSSSPAFCQATLDSICRANAISLPQSRWSGAYPAYQAGPFQIDVQRGIIQNLVAGTCQVSLPAEALRDPRVQMILANEKIASLKVTTYVENRKIYYCFVDSRRVSYCFTLENNKLDIYREVQAGHRTRWVQWVDRAVLFPKVQLTGPDWSQGIKHNIGILYELWKSLGTHLWRPKFLLQPDYHYWIDPARRQDLFVINSKGIPQFQAAIASSWNHWKLKGMIDLRPEGNSLEQEAHLLPQDAHPLWQNLAQVEDPRQIIVWRNKQGVTSVELMRFGLVFVERNGKIVCDSPPFKGWIYDPASISTPYKRGIPHALLLTHPVIPSKKRMIVPDRPIVKKLQKPAMSWWGIVELLKTAITKRRPNMSIEDPLRASFRFGNKAGVQDYWVFDMDPNTNEMVINGPRAVQGYLYLAQVCLLTQHPQDALQFLQLAKKSRQGPLMDEETNSLRALQHMALEDPDTLAVQLHSILLFRERFKASEIADAFKKYAAQTRHIDAALKVSKAQEADCLNQLKASDPAFYQAHGPLLATPDDQVERQVHHTVSTKPVKFKRQKPESKLIHFIEGIKRVLEKHPGQSLENVHVARNCTLFSENFIGLYRVASEADPKDAAFRALHHNLKAIGATQKENGLIPVMKHYLETVMDRRQKGEGAVGLPLIKGDHNATDLYRFACDLDALIAALQDDDASEEQPAPLAPDPVALKIMEQDLERALNRISADNARKDFNRLTWQELQFELPDSPARPFIIQLLGTGGDALYSPAQMREYFVEGGFKKPPPAPDLSALKQSKDSDVRIAAEELEAEIALAQKQMSQEKVVLLKDAAARSKLETALQARVLNLAKEAEALKSGIANLLHPQPTSLQALQQKSKLVKVVSWERVLKHYLQQDLLALQSDLPADVNLSLLEADLRNYLKISTQEKLLYQALSEIRAMQAGKGGFSAYSSENLYQILTAERQFDDEQFPQFLLFEYLTGLRLRRPQLQMAQDFVVDPDCVRQAITGAGKTSVILILTALLKAMGSNLVTVLFPKFIFEANLSEFQSKFGKIFQRYVYPLRYHMQMAHTKQKKTSDGIVQESIFKEMYEELLRIVLNKGVVVTTLETQQALEQKWIRLVDQMADLTDPASLPPMQREHFFYLTRILFQLRLREEKIMDEFDKGTTPREERHLKVGRGKPIPAFLWSESLNLFDHLLAADAKLGMRQNLQAEVTVAERTAHLDEVALELAKSWAAKKAVAEGERATYIQACADYLRGRDEVFLMRVDGTWTEDEKDRIALSKDQFHIFLSLTLSKTANVKYTRSKDGIRTVPCLASDVPREGAESDQVLERVNYTIQDYYQTGVCATVLREWIGDLKRSAEKEMEDQHFGSIEDTTDAQLFRSVFPEKSLRDISEEDADVLAGLVNKDPKTIRLFLEEALAKLEISQRKISADGFNLISMSKHTCGASATRRHPQAVHRRMQAAQSSEPGVLGRMVLNFIKKSAKCPPLKYDPVVPSAIVPRALQQDSHIKAVVDGAGSLYGVTSEDLARQLLPRSKGVFHFDEKGRQRVLTPEGVQSPDRVDALPEEMGLALKEAESRGADFRIGDKARFLLAVNQRQSLTKILQASGRSRSEEQEIRPVVPQASGLNDPHAIVLTGLKNGAEEEAEDLFRAKKQEIRDIVRNEMLMELIGHAMRGDLVKLVDRFKQFQTPRHKILVAENQQYLMGEPYVPGTYFQQRRHIERQNKSPVDVLNSLKQCYLAIAQNLQLAEAAKELEGLEYSPDVLQRMPKSVFGMDSLPLDQEVDVDKDTEKETDVDTEVDTDKQIEAMQDILYFPPWMLLQASVHHSLKSMHAAYSEHIACTDNFLPMDRAKKGYNRVWHRSPHDELQNPVHQIHFRKLENGPLQMCLIDVLETNIFSRRLEDRLLTWGDERHGQNYQFSGIYDLRANCVTHACGNAMDAKDLEDLHAGLAQIRFFDGQYRTYPPQEWAALKSWLARLDPLEMERYFVDKVLAHRPKDRQKYPFSPLKKLFSELQKIGKESMPKMLTRIESSVAIR